MKVLDRYGRIKTQYTAVLASGQTVTLTSGIVTSGNIGNNAVTSGNIGSGQIGPNHLASGLLNITLLSGQVQSGNIGNNAVVSGSIASGQIGTNHLASGTLFSLASGIIQSGHIGNNAVTSGSIASGQIGQSHLASGLVRSGHVGNSSITSGNVASGQISWPHLASGSVRSGHISDSAVASGSIASGQIDSYHFAFGASLSPSSEVTTTDDTETTVVTIPLQDNTTYFISAYVVARRTDSPGRAGYQRKTIVYREGGGVATILGAVDTCMTRESQVSWNATIAVSGNNVIITVTGDVGNTIDWKVKYVVVDVT